MKVLGVGGTRAGDTRVGGTRAGGSRGEGTRAHFGWRWALQTF